jgi:hypothetical protein
LQEVESTRENSVIGARSAREGILVRRIALLVLMLFVLLLYGPPASARATKTHVSFTETTVSVTPPQKEWLNGGVYHFRGLVEKTAIAGDLHGTITATYGGNINLKTGTGAVAGRFTFVTSAVTWIGSFRGLADGSGTFVGQGDDGSKIHGSFVPIGPEILQDEAVILAPRG